MAGRQVGIRPKFIQPAMGCIDESVEMAPAQLPVKMATALDIEMNQANDRQQVNRAGLQESKV